MSTNVQRILEEIEKGNLAMESSDTYEPIYPIILPHSPCLAEDEVTGFNRRYESLVWFR